MMTTIAGVGNTFQMLFISMISWIKQKSSKCHLWWFALYLYGKSFFYLPLPLETLTHIMLASMPGPVYNCKMAPVHMIKTGFHVPTNCCPFNTEEVSQWTAAKSKTALKAVPVSSLSGIEENLAGFYNSKDEKNDPDWYILIRDFQSWAQKLIVLILTKANVDFLKTNSRS